ncbi:MAG TPA: S41 family peptidase [Chitinophagaceae bacterium]|nr:S41 family peptidase [Chitinophagaceae bacterium]
MQYISKKILLVIILGVSIFISCKKTDKGTPAPTPPPPPPPVTLADKIKDTTLLYARDIYLWYKQIPADLNPRTFADPDAIMKKIREFSMEPGYPKAVDHFSFAMKQAEWNNVSSGISGDFGIDVFFFNSPAVTTDLRVKSVERESPAGKAGVKRGWRITKINGSTNINAADQASLNAVVDGVFYSSTTSFTFLKPDGTSLDLTLNATSYQTHPVMADSVYTISGKKIGYLVFDSFIGDTVEIKSELNRVFTRFSTSAVNDVVIDLRYNGGGYVSLAALLSNYLVPSSDNGSLMMRQEYNDKYSQYNSSTNFAKVGNVNLSRVFFIVSSGTASASELVINNLKGLSDIEVKLIGRDNTYGKPVGYFPIPVGDWYIFPVSFKTVNKIGQSNYYNGFTPDAIKADGLDKNWGDITETSLASAIKYITTGAFRLQTEPSYQELPEITNANLTLDKHSFKGTIDTRKILR